MAKQKSKPPIKQVGAMSADRRTVREAFVEAFEAMQTDHYADYNLLQWGKKNPDKFYLLISKLIPLQVNTQITSVNLHVIRE